MTSVGWATLDVIPSFKGLRGELEKGSSGPLRAAGVKGGTLFGDAAGRSAGARFGSVFKTAAKAGIVGALGAGALAIKVGADSITSASDLNESLNAVNVTYGKQARGVKKLGQESAKSLGLSNSAFNGLAVQYSAFAKTIGGDKKTVRTLDNLTTRASDFASVMNLEVSDAATLFQSGLAGETEPLRKFGIDLSAASVQAFAYSNGIAKSGDELTETQKVQARYGSLMEQTQKTQGDFANTSDQLANQQRILAARFEDSKAKLGTALLPIMSKAADFLLDKGIPAFDRFSDWFVKDGVPAISGFVDDVKPLANKLLPAAADAFDAIRAGAKKALPIAEDLVGAFNDMPDWAKKALVGGTVAGFTAKKLLPSGLGSTAQALGLTKPVNVFVTNPGFGKGGPGGALGGGLFGKTAGVAMAATFAIPFVDELSKKTSLDEILDAGKLGDKLGLPDLFGKDTRKSVSGKDNPWSSLYDAEDLEGTSMRIDSALDATRGKAAGLGRELDLVGDRKVTPLINKQSINESKDALAKFIGLQIDAGRPVTPYINTTSIERAIAQARTLNAALAGNSVPTAGMDNGVGFQHGNTGTSPNTRAGVTQNFYGDIKPNDMTDFQRLQERKAREGQRGGRG